MASIQILKGCRYFYISYIDENGERQRFNSRIRHSPQGPSKIADRNREAAQAMADNLEKNAKQLAKAKKSGTKPEPVDGESSERFPSVKEYADSWMQEHYPESHSEQSVTAMNYRIRLFLDWLGPRQHKRLIDVSAEDIYEFRQEIIPSRSRTSVNAIISGVKRMLQQAQEQGLILANPVPFIRHLKTSECTRKRFDIAEIQKLINCAGSIDWRTHILLGFYCGMEATDAATAKWEWINLRKRRMTWVSQHSRGIRPLEVTTPLHPKLLKHLRSLPKGIGPWVTPSLAERYPAFWRNNFGRLMKAAKIDPEIDTLPCGRTIATKGFFSIKWAFQKCLTNAGIDERMIQRLCGCSSAEFDYPIEELEEALLTLPKLRVPKGLCQA